MEGHPHQASFMQGFRILIEMRYLSLKLVMDPEYWKKQFRKLVFLREQIITKMDIDYIIIDTSPGIRHWSINALSIADKLILTMKMDDLDIEGTKKLLNEIYTTFVKFGAITYILLHRISGVLHACNTNQSFRCQNKFEHTHILSK